MSKLKEQIYIEEVSGHHARYRRLVSFTHSSTRAAMVMLLGAVIAVILASSPYAADILHFWHTEVMIGFGTSVASMSLGHIINDMFMAIFFLLVGLEVKYELTVGELTNIRQAILPVIAAVGGVVVPIIIYVSLNASSPETINGWGVPTATDIAFALGIMSLLGSRVPNGVKVFLSTLAVADDIIAILIIAIFYGHAPSLGWLLCAGVIYLVLIVFNKRHVYSLAPYLIGGALLWYCVFSSGIHATIAGVLLAFVIPSCSSINIRKFTDWSRRKVSAADSIFNPDEPLVSQKEYLETVQNLSKVSKHVTPPAVRLEHRLYPWVYFGILPLFALSNADVAVSGEAISQALSCTALPGVFFGLLIGKPLGILLASFLVVKIGKVSLPENANWGHMIGAAILGGVGFTMAIFVANLAYSDPSLVASAKIGILASSLTAGILGFIVLLVQARKAEAKGVSYVHSSTNYEELLAADQEEARKSKRFVKKVLKEREAQAQMNHDELESENSKLPENREG